MKGGILKLQETLWWTIASIHVKFQLFGENVKTPEAWCASE